jgi:fatty acid desaturase
MQSVAWTIMMRSAVYPVPLCKNEHSKSVLKETYRISFYAIFVYAACTIIAFWFPQVIAMIITFIWIMWLFWGLHFKESQPRKINVKM